MLPYGIKVDHPDPPLMPQQVGRLEIAVLDPHQMQRPEKL